MGSLCVPYFDSALICAKVIANNKSFSTDSDFKLLEVLE